MDVLVFGGTQFIGRHMVEELLRGDHRVTVFTRGVTADPLPTAVERLHGNRNEPDGLAALGARTWDACVDVSGYLPRQVRPSAERLRGRVHQYLFVSSVSAYVDSQDVPVRETHALLPEAAEDITEITGDTYGPLKVTCERIVREAYGARSVILRPQIVAGPWDPTGRYTYWVQRAGQGGEMLAPGTGRDRVQVVDVRDIARFTRTVLERGIGGVFNMAGPPMTWASFMDLLGAKAPVWVSADVIDAAGLTFVEMPLFRAAGASRASLMQVSHETASEAGFTVTDAATTAADVREWLRDHPVRRALSEEREAALIATTRRHSS